MYYIYLADGFEETEALVTLDFMRRAGINVMTAGVTGKSVTGSHGITVTADCIASDVSEKETEGVILPGGMPGTVNLEKSAEVIKSVIYCADNGKPLCAICAAPSIFGHLGILDGKKATCFPGFENDLKGATIENSPCVAYKNIITARGAGSVFDFSSAIITLICGKEKAESVLKQAQCI